MHVTIVDPGWQVPLYDAALAGALAASGWRVHLATALHLAYEPPETPSGVDQRAEFGRLLARMPAAARHRPSRRLLRALGYPREWRALAGGLATGDVVHVQWSLAPLVEARALRALARRGVPGVLTVHNVLPHEPRPWHRPALARLYGSAGALVVHSEAARRRLLAVAPAVPPAIVHTIPMAALPLPATTSDRNAARARLGLPAGAPLALFLGHIRPYKGVSGLLRAWPAVVRAVPAATLVIAGAVAGGPRAAVRLADACRAVGATARLGIVAARDAGDLLVAADVVVLPYRAVDDSAVLQAARGHGRAVVATGVGGLPEVLAHGGGRVVPPDDPEALSAALAALLGDPVERAAHEAATRTAAAAWTWADVAEASVRAYGSAQRAVAAGQARHSGRSAVDRAGDDEGGRR